jgi:hypothetical protein
MHKTKNGHIQTYMKNLFAIVELLYGTWDRKREWYKLKNIDFILYYLCIDTEYNNMYWKLLNNREWEWRGKGE